MSKSEYKIVRGKVSETKLATADNPIYSMGVLFGITKLPKSSKIEDQETGLESQKKEQDSEKLKKEQEYVKE